MMSKSRGQVIREARQAAGLSQAELSRRVGFASNASISNLELGKGPLAFDVAVRIANACGVPPAEFLATIAAAETEHAAA